MSKALAEMLTFYRAIACRGAFRRELAERLHRRGLLQNGNENPPPYLSRRRFPRGKH